MNDSSRILACLLAINTRYSNEYSLPIPILALEIGIYPSHNQLAQPPLTRLHRNDSALDGNH